MTAVMEASSARRSLARSPGIVRPEGSPSRRSERERGAAMVEFALVLPVFVALVFGIVSYGYMLSYRQALGQAASEGARAVAIVPSGMDTATKTTKSRTAINDALGGYGVTCSGTNLVHGSSTDGTCSIQPNVACPADATRRCAVVTVTHAYRANPLVPSFPGLGVTLPQNLTYTSVVEVN
ncbi:pilus assembly protein [Aeromicrobium fastidiosum]|uniref:Pilus assembly protein n=2 Tax=Aeromicrobium fastidiosum TaxID=52699 RepID=A0A641ANZ2_9ACTN|nr:pilus assembly protein [Aeromicrobium fastidiosum]